MSEESHDLFEIMSTTRSMRRLKPDPVPVALIGKILEAGVSAPSGGNMQRWRFIVVRDEPSVPRLRSLAEFVKPRSPPRPFRAGGVGRARAPTDSPRTKPSLPSRATFKISREDRDRSGQNSGREWDSLIKPETSLIADLNSLQGRIMKSVFRLAARRTSLSAKIA